MRLAIILTVLLLAASRSHAESDFAAEVHSARPFGYFVGDLVRARVEIHAPHDARLLTSSLPHAGPVSTYVELRDLKVEQTRRAGDQVWELQLVYQSFYVALDVRDIAVPAFTLTFQTPAGPRNIEVPPWAFGVGPLREITPEKKERAEDYLRPDGEASSISLDSIKTVTAASVAALLLLALAVARDRAWPPFHRRRHRPLSALARRLGAQGRGPVDEVVVRNAMQDLHRALDTAYGRSLVATDIADFSRLNPAFVTVEPEIRAFFRLTEGVFFGGDHGLGANEFREISRIAGLLAKRERAA